MRATFRSMGCDVVVEGAAPAALAAIERLFEERDARFSRFRAGSELNRVNAARGSIVAASEEFLRAVRAALSAARATDGLVDPTLGAAVQAAGYDRDSSELPEDGPLAPVPTRVDWRSVRAGRRLVARPEGTILDLNGVVKAMAVDDAAGLLTWPGYVSAGGDVAVRGEPVVVGVPGGDAVELRSGGMATSGSLSRSWRRGGELQHHLIDPETLRPARSPWLAVTAVGRDCLAADIAAKAGFLLGADGPDWLEARGVAARFLADDRVVCNAVWREGLERESAAA